MKWDDLHEDSQYSWRGLIRTALQAAEIQPSREQIEKAAQAAYEYWVRNQ